MGVMGEVQAPVDSVGTGVRDADATAAVLADAVDLADVLVIVTDAERRIIDARGPFERILRTPAEALIGHEPTEYLHPADIDWRDRIRAELARAGRASGRARVRGHGVEHTWMETRLEVRPDGGLLMLLRPIEARIDAEVAFRIDPYVVLETVRDEAGAVVDLRCLAANDGAAAAFATTATALQGALVREVLPPKDAGNVVAWCEQALAGGDVSLDDESWAPVDGGPTRFIDVRAIGSGDTVNLTWRDATERHTVAVALAEREAAYRLIADHATDVIIRTSLTAGIEWASPSVTEMLGWTPEELVGRRVSELMHPDDLAAARSRQRAIIESGQDDGRITARFATADGGWRWMSDHGRLVRDADGTPIAGIDALRDVEVEQAALAALQRRERELRGIIDTLIDPWVLFESVRDDSGAIVDFVWVDANDAACAFNHMTREQMIGARLLEVLPEHGPRGIIATYAAVVETGVPLVEDDQPFTSPFDGQVRRFDNRATRVGDGISFTWRDVTERYETQRALRLQAEHDTLTGVANRRQLERRLGEILGRRPRTGTQVAVLYCDLDQFKDINDTLGHAAGDDALAQVARRVREAIRDGDVVARLGGDEFVVVLDGIRGADDATAVAAKVADSVRRPASVGGIPVSLRLSIGVAVALPAEDPTHALARADRALYQAKQAGRDRVVLAVDGP